jgi:hypothetical protein
MKNDPIISFMGNTFRYSYHTELVIPAAKETIWNVLTDLESYQKWNPFTPKIDTNWEIDQPVILTVQMKKGKNPILQKEYLRLYEPPNTMSWGMNWGLFLKAERIQQLTSVSENKTIYYTEDVITGILAPLVHLLYGYSVQRGFEQVGLSLKKYIENS